MSGLTRRFKINGCPTQAEFASMPFGRQIDIFRAFDRFKAEAKHVHLSQKRRTNSSTIREAIKLYGATEYYCQFYDSSEGRDDSFQFWYR